MSWAGSASLLVDRRRGRGLADRRARLREATGVFAEDEVGGTSRG